MNGKREGRTVNEQALGKQLEQPSQPRCIEIGRVEGDALIIGGASHLFLQVPGKPGAEGIFEDGSDVVRLASLPARSELEDPFEEDSSARSTGTASSTPLSREERDAKRRAILEELRTSAISIEEAERRLNDLG